MFTRTSQHRLSGISLLCVLALLLAGLVLIAKPSSTVGASSSATAATPTPTPKGLNATVNAPH
jgi:hypothetical protein